MGTYFSGFCPLLRLTFVYFFYGVPLEEQRLYSEQQYFSYFESGHRKEADKIAKDYRDREMKYRHQDELVRSGCLVFIVFLFGIIIIGSGNVWPRACSSSAGVSDQYSFHARHNWIIKDSHLSQVYSSRNAASWNIRS